MLSLLFQGWVIVLAGAQAQPQSNAELPLAEPSVESSVLEPGAEFPVPEPSVEPSELEAGMEFPVLESGAEFSAFEPGLGWALFQTVLVLAGVVLLAYILLSWGGKYLLKLRETGGQRVISIIERVAVDARKSLLLVKAGNDYFLLSSGEKALTVLSKLNTEEVEQALSNRKPAGEPGLFLKKLLERKQPGSH